MDAKDLVSIVIPVYNSGPYVAESIQSAVNQTYKHKEIIVVDDGSNATTKAVLAGLTDHIDVHLTQANAGQSTARNKGVQHAKGTYILIQDADDIFKPTFVEKAVKILNEQQDVKFVSCYLNRFDDKKVGPLVQMDGGTLTDYLFRNASIGNGLFRKADLESISGYDETMRSGYEDWELMIRMLKSGGRVYVIPEPLFMYRSSLKITTTKAANFRPELLTYIFSKHKDMYSEHYEELLAFFEKEQKKLHHKSVKMVETKEYTLGEAILKPLRLLKSRIKK